MWNAFVDLLAREDYGDLTSEQRPAHLVFLYDAELMNGGHLQYFHNRGADRVDETVRALTELGASCQSSVLAEAARLWLSTPRSEIQTLQDYSAEALEGEFNELDSRYYDCTPPVEALLMEHLSRNQSTFIEIT